MVEVSDININTQHAANAFDRWRWTSCSQIRYIITIRKQNIPALTHSLQTPTAMALRPDRPVCPAPYMAAARGPPPHHPPAHPTARRTAQDLPMIRAPHMAHTPAMILQDHFRPTTGPAVDGSRSAARGTTIRHSLAISNAAAGQVADRVTRGLLGGRGGALGPGDWASSLVTRRFSPSTALITAL
jgi:hypothetical protein